MIKWISIYIFYAVVYMYEFVCVYIYIYIGREEERAYLIQRGEESNVTCVQDSMLYRLSSKILVVYFHLKECNYFPQECCRRKFVLETESDKKNKQQ